uniref:Looped-hinge helix DNA binding domain-containing protein, AbrB family n=1 Tax=Candidatus Kentrum sp. FW TaxID=2126338 RepID=A0A450TMD6_9GAMM|nr:MAG: looped-hinge helix DNA binding domain-containing protein, AbrB family [Candidatus Kentron sp. FW]
MLAATVTISPNGQIEIPKNVFDSLHWRNGMELTLTATGSGVMLTPKGSKKNKLSASSLRGCLQHTGEPISTERLCRPVEYGNDSL